MHEGEFAFLECNINHPENQYKALAGTQQNRLKVGPLSVDISDLNKSQPGCLLAACLQPLFPVLPRAASYSRGSELNIPRVAWAVRFRMVFGPATRFRAGSGEPTFSREVNTLEAGVMVLLEILQDQAFQRLRDPSITHEGSKKFRLPPPVWHGDK